MAPGLQYTQQARSQVSDPELLTRSGNDSIGQGIGNKFSELLIDKPNTSLQYILFYNNFHLNERINSYSSKINGLRE